MSNRSLRRALAPLLLVGALSGTALALGSAPAGAAATIAQASRCEGDIPRLDVTIANDEAADLTVDLRLEATVVEAGAVVPAEGQVTLTVTYPQTAGTIAVVDSATDAVLASVPLTAADPGCELPDETSSDISVSSASPCEEGELLPEVIVTNDSPIDAVVDVYIDGELSLGLFQVPGGESVSQALVYGDATHVEVRDSATGQVLAEGDLAATQCPGGQVPPAAAPAPAVALEHAPAYTG